MILYVTREKKKEKEIKSGRLKSSLKNFQIRVNLISN